MREQRALANVRSIPSFGDWAVGVHMAICLIPRRILDAFTFHAQGIRDVLVQVFVEACSRVAANTNLILFFRRSFERMLESVPPTGISQKPGDHSSSFQSGHQRIGKYLGTSTQAGAYGDKASFSARSLRSNGTVAVEVSSDEMPVHINGHRRVFQGSALGGRYPEPQQRTAHNNAVDLHHIAVSMKHRINGAVETKRGSRLMQTLQIGQRYLPGAQFSLKASVTSDQAKNPGHGWRPRVKELLVIVVAARCAFFHAIIIRLSFGLELQASIQNVAAKLSAPTAEIASYLFHAVTKVPVAMSEVICGDRIFGMQNVIHGMSIPHPTMHGKRTAVVNAS